MARETKEGKITRKLVETFRATVQGAILFRHEDFFTAAIPDISITGERRTVWWEVKVAEPEFESPEIQELTMLRLAHVGFAFYLIYVAGPPRSVRIVHPKSLNAWRTSGTSTNGFNHAWVIERMMEVQKQP